MSKKSSSKKSKAHPTSKDKAGPQPIPSPGVQCFDVESHKVTEIFEPGDVVFTREGGAMELRAQPRHEAETRFAKITEGSMKSEFKDHQTVTTFSLEDGRKVTQRGHETLIVNADQSVDSSGPRLNIHAADFQG